MNKSEHVKNWRKRTKQRIVDAFGEVCGVCNKKYPPEIYDLHHEFGEKEFSLSSIRASSKSWDKIVIELRKCVMLCSNCHRMLHNGYIELPKNIHKFNEYYSDYDRFPNKCRPMNECLVCGSLCFNKFCSHRCAQLNSRKVKSRPEIFIIKKLVDRIGYSATGRMYGVSDNAIRKWIRNNGV